MGMNKKREQHARDCQLRLHVSLTSPRQTISPSSSPSSPPGKHLLLNRIRHPPRRLILLLNRPSPPLPLRHLLILLDDIAARAAARLEHIRATIPIEVILVADIRTLHSRGDGRQAQHAGAAEEKALSIHQHTNTHPRGRGRNIPTRCSTSTRRDRRCCARGAASCRRSHRARSSRRGRC